MASSENSQVFEWSTQMESGRIGDGFENNHKGKPIDENEINTCHSQMKTSAVTQLLYHLGIDLSYV